MIIKVSGSDEHSGNAGIPAKGPLPGKKSHREDGGSDVFSPKLRKKKKGFESAHTGTERSLEGETGSQVVVNRWHRGRRSPDETTPEKGVGAFENDTKQDAKSSFETVAPFPEDRPVNSEEPTSIFEPGEVIENTYRVLYVLGSGSMGVVYLAEDMALKRKVAIKGLAPVYQEDKEVAEKFHREAVAMAKVRHPNVVQIYSFGTHQGHSYFVMEYIKGMSLADLVEKHQGAGELMPVQEAVGLLAQVCRGVHAIHKKGIVHRDIKPANILLDQEYRVSVVDFGLVRTMESDQGKALELDGTPMYLAPERIRSTPVPKDQAHLCDIYSLGGVFYEVLTGYPPFESDSILAVLDCHLTEDPPDPLQYRPELPSTARWVIRKAMAKDPSKRFQSCLEMETALNDTRTGKIVTGGPLRSTMEAKKLMLFVLIDSREDLRSQIRMSLEQSYPQAKIYEAEEGEKGLQLALDLRPQLVVCCAEALNKNALEICARLGSEPPTVRPKILVTDKKVDPMRRKLYQDLGASDLVKRHMPSKEFIAIISELLPSKEV